ncbi:MAG: sugar kinase [Clostridia bacterium]|nr:sugar kinase [Clostridia bacterium]
MLTQERIHAIEAALRDKTVAILGDFCLDIYWQADMTRSELSRETPHFPLPVVEERVSLGAGGNVAANLAALGPKEILAVSLYGDDWRGRLLAEEVKKAGVSPEWLVPSGQRFTNAYCKPLRKGISATVYEDPRLDFENDAPIGEAVEDAVIQRLRSAAQRADFLCVADQFRFGIVTARVRSELIALAKSGLPVIVDSRYRIGEYTDCILKPNEVECWRAVYGNDGYRNASLQALTDAADALAQRNRAAVFCTLGANGSYLTEGENGIRTSAVPVSGEVDICGAGDTTLAAFTCALAAGATREEAARLAAMASAVTVKKIGETGTATFSEMLSLAEAASGAL